MATGPGGFTGTRDAAGASAAVPGETRAVPLEPPAAGSGSSIRPAPGQDCPSFAGFLHILITGGFRPRGREGTTVFCITGACTSCGACEAACPAKNITMNKTAPVWGDRCGLCLACVRTCPVQAIRIEGRPPETGNGSKNEEGENHP
jgi:ferredoxin